MPVSETPQNLRNGKIYETAVNTSISENDSSEANPNMSAHETDTDIESETRILTQQEVDEQIRKYIALLTK